MANLTTTHTNKKLLCVSVPYIMHNLYQFSSFLEGSLVLYGGNLFLLRGIPGWGI